MTMPYAENSSFTLQNGNTWFIKINKDGIFFNREIYPNSSPNDFANVFIKILEMNYNVRFLEKGINEEFHNDLKTMILKINGRYIEFDDDVDVQIFYNKWSPQL